TSRSHYCDRLKSGKLDAFPAMFLHSPMQFLNVLGQVAAKLSGLIPPFSRVLDQRQTSQLTLYIPPKALQLLEMSFLERREFLPFQLEQRWTRQDGLEDEVAQGRIFVRGDWRRNGP